MLHNTALHRATSHIITGHQILVSPAEKRASPRTKWNMKQHNVHCSAKAIITSMLSLRLYDHAHINEALNAKSTQWWPVSDWWIISYFATRVNKQFKFQPAMQKLIFKFITFVYHFTKSRHLLLHCCDFYITLEAFFWTRRNLEASSPKIFFNLDEWIQQPCSAFFNS